MWKFPSCPNAAEEDSASSVQCLALPPLLPGPKSVAALPAAATATAPIAPRITATATAGGTTVTATCTAASAAETAAPQAVPCATDAPRNMLNPQRSSYAEGRCFC